MQKNKISNRIHLIAKQAKILKPYFLSIADIGTDHGYLPYVMHSDDSIGSSILCDINNGPLENAKKSFEGHDQYPVEFRLGSGIEPLEPKESELVVIAGMGGGLIQDILMNDLEKSKSYPYFLIQPMTEQDQLRSFLIDNGFNILWDHFFIDAKKHYELIVVSTNFDTDEEYKYDLISIPCNDLEFGKRIRKSQVDAYLEFLENKKSKYEYILNQVTKNNYNEKVTMCNTKLSTILTIEQTLKTL